MLLKMQVISNQPNSALDSIKICEAVHAYFSGDIIKIILSYLCVPKNIRRDIVSYRICKDYLYIRSDLIYRYNASRPRAKHRNPQLTGFSLTNINFNASPYLVKISLDMIVELHLKNFIEKKHLKSELFMRYFMLKRPFSIDYVMSIEDRYEMFLEMEISSRIVDVLIGILTPSERMDLLSAFDNDTDPPEIAFSVSDYIRGVSHENFIEI
jgi:hypothetical protein